MACDASGGGRPRLRRHLARDLRAQRRRARVAAGGGRGAEAVAPAGGGAEVHPPPVQRHRQQVQPADDETGRESRSSAVRQASARPTPSRYALRTQDADAIVQEAIETPTMHHLVGSRGLSGELRHVGAAPRGVSFMPCAPPAVQLMTDGMSAMAVMPVVTYADT